MSKKIGFIASLVVSSLLVAGTAAATEQTPRVDKRQENQAQRIGQGVRSGELTYRETKRLVNGQQHVRKLERRAKADGDVTAAERARLEAANDRQSKRIYRQKHDAQTRN